MKHLLFAAAILVFIGAIAYAQTTSSGTLALSGEVDSSIGFFFWQDPSGYQLTEGGSSATIEIGDVSAYGTPNGLQANKFTKTLDSDGFHLTTPFLLQVMEANASSANFKLTAQLGDDDDTIWAIDGHVLSTTPALISNTEPFDDKRPHTLFVKFLFAKTAVSLTDTITFTATAN